MEADVRFFGEGEEANFAKDGLFAAASLYLSIRE